MKKEKSTENRLRLYLESVNEDQQEEEYCICSGWNLTNTKEINKIYLKIDGYEDRREYIPASWIIEEHEKIFNLEKEIKKLKSELNTTQAQLDYHKSLNDLLD